jgi:hypothetical protein
LHIAIAWSFWQIMDAREKQIAPPTSWETFEDLCLALFKAMWKDPLAQKNGRRGQTQHGVDVFGSLNGLGTAFFGIQCKGKDQSLGAKATVKELENELAKAERFNPSLVHWIFATTAPTDAVLQEAARKLSMDRTAKGHFPVSVLGWGDIQALLVEHRTPLEQFYPEAAFDLPNLLRELRRSSSGDAIDAFRQNVAELNAALSTRTLRRSTSWLEITFDDVRDLGPALMGRSLGPADIAACPILPEAATTMFELESAFSARLEGQPGVGKSMCAFQVARMFVDRGWVVFKLADPRVNVIEWLPSDDRKILYLIDDAHLTQAHVLQTAEAETGSKRMLLSTHNAMEQGTGGRGAIVMDGKRAVSVIAAKLRASRATTLEAVQRSDDRIGDRPHDESLDRRLDAAERDADRPWQFCFILGGGWRRASTAADAARLAHSDLILAAIAIRQLASRDARPSLAEVHKMLKGASISIDAIDNALNWLIDARLIIGANDLRTPHQRFATVVLARILAGQDKAGRLVIGELLNYAMEDAAHPLAGLRQLLHEVHFLDHKNIWTHLIQPARLNQLLSRCWAAQNAEDRASAMLVFDELRAYIPNWPHSVLDDHLPTIIEWFSDPKDPSGFAIGRLTNSIRQVDEKFAESIVGASDPERIAATVSNATASTAYNIAEMVSLMGGTKPEPWKTRFDKAIDRQALLSLGKNWPKSEPIFLYAKLCYAMLWTEEKLALGMVEAFLPSATQALAEDPVTAFHELDDIVSRVLRVHDVLGAYVGKHSPSARGRQLATALCTAIKPKILAQQISAVDKRGFQQAAMLLSFLSKAALTKFRQTIGAMNWDQIDATIGDDWARLFHDAEVFLGVCFHRRENRTNVTALIERNAYRIEIMVPRLVLMAPEVAYRHVEQGRQISISAWDHIDWRFGAAVIVNFSEARPDLVDAMLAPAEATAGRVLSQRDKSWYREATLFLRVMRQVAPQSLQRILEHVDVESAEIGWITSISSGGEPRRTVSLLVESALQRADRVGQMAQRIRNRFPKQSHPKQSDLEQID